MPSHTPAFKFDPEQFLTATDGLTNGQVGSLMRLLVHQWINGDVPANPSKAAKLCHGNSADADKALESFSPSGNGRCRNMALEAVRNQRNA